MQTLPADSTPRPTRCAARLLTPLDDGGTRYLDDALIDIDADGGVARVETWTDQVGSAGAAVDIRPLIVMPGLVDMHAHLPQWPNAGLGAGLDLLTWLQRYIFPLEREFHADAARRLAPVFFKALAAAGTTTALLYGAVFEDSVDEAFGAAEEHGIRLVLGKVMMDRFRYDESLADSAVLSRSVAESQRLIERWHGRDNGRLQYAVTPRFAVSCSADMLRESAELARSTGTYWQTHLAEDRNEIEEVGRLFPEAIDYTDVYDRAGALGPKSVVAHAVHLGEREVHRLSETGTRIAHCPSSNLFLASGAMPLARYLQAGIVVALGSDVAAGPDVSIFGEMRAGVVHPERPPNDAGRPRAGDEAVRLAAPRLARRRARARARLGHRLDRNGQGRRLHLRRCIGNVDRRWFRYGRSGRACEPADLSHAAADGPRRVGARKAAAGLAALPRAHQLARELDVVPGRGREREGQRAVLEQRVDRRASADLSPRSHRPSRPCRSRSH